MSLHRFTLFILAITLAFGYSSAQEDKKIITVTFDDDKFTLVHEDSGSIFICSNDEDVCYSSNSALPCLPYVSVNICIPNGYYYYTKYEISEGTGIVYPNVKLSSNPIVVPSSYDGNVSPLKNLSFSGQYPMSC